MWLVWFDKKKNVDVDVFVYAVLVLTSVKPGLGRGTCGLPTKREGRTRDQNLYQFSLSKPPEPAGFGASLVLRTIVFYPGMLTHLDNIGVQKGRDV